jgi:hypothetical protein
MCYTFIDRDTVMKNLILLLGLIVSAAAHAGVYKWVDDNGKVHYGDSPQASQATVEMNVDQTTTESSVSEDLLSREEKRERLLQSMEEDRIEKQEQRDKRKAENDRNRQKCNRYRDRMRHYERANALYKLDRDGNRVYMSESERASATKSLRARISKYCR